MSLFSHALPLCNTESGARIGIHLADRVDAHVLIKDTIPSASALAATMAWSSASALDNVTVFCWREYAFSTCDPTVTMPPDVLRAVSLQPAQPLSV